MINIKNIASSWRLFWILSFFMLALMLWPFIAAEYLGLADYANHLSRLQILTGNVHEGWQKYYYIHFEIVPNLALDLIAHGFVKLGLSPEVALRLFAAITAVLLVAGTYAMAFVINRSPPWLATLSFLLVFNRYFVWGFLNYFFSIGVGFLLFAFWIYIRNNARINQVKFKFWFYSFTSLLLLFVLLSHLVGYGLTLSFIFVYEFCRCFEMRFTWKQSLNHLSKVIMVFIPSILFYIFICAHANGSEGLGIYYYAILKSKFAGLMSPFFSYSESLTYVYIFGFFITAILMTSHLGSLKKIIDKLYPSKLYLIPCAVFVMFLVLPSAVMGSHFLDKRIAVVVVFLLLGLTVFQLNGKKLMVIIAIVIMLQLIKTLEVSNVWALHSNATSQISKALNNIKPQSTIEGFAFSDNDRMPVPPIQHAVTLAISQRAAFVPTLFAFPVNLESIGFNKPYSKVAYSTGALNYKYSMNTLEHLCNGYSEYILVTFMKNKPEVPSCLTPIADGDNFVLYRLKGKPAPIK